MTPDDVRAAVELLYAEHRQAPFPPEALSIETAAGGEVVMLDADVAGCVDTWIHRRGLLDPWRKEVLSDGVAELDRVIPLLDRPARRYFERLHQLAMMVLSASS